MPSGATASRVSGLTLVILVPFALLTSLRHFFTSSVFFFALHKCIRAPEPYHFGAQFLSRRARDTAVSAAISHHGALLEAAKAGCFHGSLKK